MRIALVVIMLFLLCGIGVCAESPRQIKQEKGMESKQATKNQQHGTEEFPFVVKTMKPPKTKEEADSDADDRNDRKSLNNFTLALVIVGTLQFIALFFQVYFLCKTLRATKEAANAAQKSAEVAEKSLTMVERPYIHISGISKFLYDYERQEYSVAFELSNHGRTPADIENICAEISNNLEVGINYPMDTLFSPLMLEAGGKIQGIKQPIPCNLIPFTHQGSNATPNLTSTDDIYFRAIVKYHGFVGEVYEDSFFWIYDRSVKTFVPRRDAEYYYKKKH